MAGDTITDASSAESRPRSTKAYKSFFRKPLTLRRRLTVERQDEISRTNSTTSRLLALPTEVRQQIFAHVVGGNVIDISEFPKPNSRQTYYAYNICADDRLCLIANFFRTVNAGRRWRMRSVAGGNVTCSTGGRSGRAKRWLALFFVCRQTYHDAKQLLWSENLLFFWDAEPLWRFTNGVRLTEQSASIRSIALVVDTTTTMYAAAFTAGQPQLQQIVTQWSHGRMGDVASRLSGLKVLYLLLKLPVDLIVRSGDKKGKWKSMEWLSGLMQLKRLSLQKVRVVVELPKESLSQRSEGSIEGMNAFRKLYQISDQDCEEYSRQIEAALLGT